jgi:hypothetical protein
MSKSDLNKFFLSKKSPLRPNQKQRLKAEMRYEKEAEKKQPKNK